ncbi:hypothetical protein ACU8KH_02427 [Lachancea thermotolerans]
MCFQLKVGDAFPIGKEYWWVVAGVESLSKKESTACSGWRYSARTCYRPPFLFGLKPIYCVNEWHDACIRTKSHSHHSAMVAFTKKDTELSLERDTH